MLQGQHPFGRTLLRGHPVTPPVSVLLVLAHQAFCGGIDEPEQIENLLQVPVFATIPHSRKQEHIQDRLPIRSGKMSLLACVASDHVAI